MHFLQHMREILYYYLISQTLTDVHRLNEYSTSTVDRYHDLDSPQYITMVTLNTSTYALVSSLFDPSHKSSFS